MNPALKLLLATLLVTLVAAANACGGQQRPRLWNETAHIAVNSAAHAVQIADALAADSYSHATDALDAREHRFAPVLTALRESRDALLVTEAALDVYESTHEADAKCRVWVTAGAALDHVSALTAPLRDAGVRVPDEIASGASAIRGLIDLLSPQCGGADAGR